MNKERTNTIAKAQTSLLTYNFCLSGPELMMLLAGTTR